MKWFYFSKWIPQNLFFLWFFSMGFANNWGRLSMNLNICVHYDPMSWFWTWKTEKNIFCFYSELRWLISVRVCLILYHLLLVVHLCIRYHSLKSTFQVMVVLSVLVLKALYKRMLRLKHNIESNLFTSIYFRCIRAKAVLSIRDKNWLVLNCGYEYLNCCHKSIKYMFWKDVHFAWSKMAKKEELLDDGDEALLLGTQPLWYNGVFWK